MRLNPHHIQNVARGLTRSSHRYLMEESRRRADEAAKEIGKCLDPATGGADPRGAYVILKRWYWHTSTRTPNPYWTDIEKVRGDLQTLYQREEPHPPGLNLDTHVDPAKVSDKIPSEAEVEAAVQPLRPHKAGGHNHLCAEHFKQ